MDPRIADVVGGGYAYTPAHPLVDPIDNISRHYRQVPGGVLAALAAAAEYEGNPDWAVQVDPAAYDEPLMRGMDAVEDEYPVQFIRDFVRERVSPGGDEYLASQTAMLSGLSGEDIDQQFTPLIDTGDSYGDYLMRPASIDPRLAEAKRLYARLTGKVVDTPEEAVKAWELYKRNYQDALPLNDPAMGEDYQWYEKYPELMKQMMQRMPGVVSTGEGDTYG